MWLIGHKELTKTYKESSDINIEIYKIIKNVKIEKHIFIQEPIDKKTCSQFEMPLKF